MCEWGCLSGIAEPAQPGSAVLLPWESRGFTVGPLLMHPVCYFTWKSRKCKLKQKIGDRRVGK